MGHNCLEGQQTITPRQRQALAMAARIQSIPTLFFITKDGDIERQVGAVPYRELTRLAESIME